jgi:hypothetical protein
VKDVTNEAAVLADADHREGLKIIGYRRDGGAFLDDGASADHFQRSNDDGVNSR